jgi:hypothetical protein
VFVHDPNPTAVEKDAKVQLLKKLAQLVREKSKIQLGEMASEIPQKMLKGWSREDWICTNLLPTQYVLLFFD